MSTLKQIPITKYQGTGNDFLFINGMDPQFIDEVLANFPRQNRPKIVEKICHRKFGIGADGLIFMEASKDHDFAWDFYNSDGSSAEMCGNAARCVAKYAQEMGVATSPMSFLSIAGPIRASVGKDNLISVTTTAIKQLKSSSTFTYMAHSLEYSLWDTGVPHATAKLPDDVAFNDVKGLARALRNSKDVGPRGANVTYYKPRNQNMIEAISFERGVEDFTLACGTGVIAAAHDFSSGKLQFVEVQVPGGKLKVDFSEELPKLIGPAQRIGEFYLDPDFLNSI